MSPPADTAHESNSINPPRFTRPTVGVGVGVGIPPPQPGPLGGAAGYEELTPLVMQLSEPDKVRRPILLGVLQCCVRDACSHIIALPYDRCQRETALMELSKKREVFPDLAPILWHTVGTMAALLQVRRGLID